ncbi:MAG: hypothetical protein EKK48_12270 [Candidatus Melainabacteria bacterium]|nr:MAG: hypothetical protein EKK48_12270 [Candidatus Melainabacteria bacterium]
MGVKTTTSPNAEPLDLAEVKAHLRVDHDDQDLLIQGLITASREFAENYTQRSFITQEITQTHDCFPNGSRPDDTRIIELEKGPVQAVLAVQYFDEVAGAYATIDPADYQVSLTSDNKDRLAPAPGKNWPSTNPERLDAVKIRSRCGYGGTGALVPRQARNAMLMLIALWYANPEAFLLAQQGQEFPVPIGFDALLWSIRSF